MNEPTMKSPAMKELFQALTSIKTEKECALFMRDLCTLSELKAMAERFQVVQQVRQGTPYRKIAQKTGASTATITRVAHWLHHGMGGYQLVLHRLKMIQHRRVV